MVRAVRKAVPPTPSFGVRAFDGQVHAVECSAFPILTAHGSQGAIAIFWPDRRRREPTDRGRVKVDLWGRAAPSPPPPGDDPLRRQHELRRRHPLRRLALALDVGTGLRTSAWRSDDRSHPAPHPPHPPAPGPHPGPRLLRARSSARRPRSDLGPGLARGQPPRSDRPLHLGAAPPVEVRELPCDVTFRACPKELEIGSARITAASVAHRGPTLGYRIEDAAPPRSPTSPTTSRRSAPTWNDPRPPMDLRLRPRPGHRPLDSRRPVRRRGVRRPPRLGPLGALPHSLSLRPADGGTAHRPLPPRPAALGPAGSTGTPPGRAQSGWRGGARAGTVELAREGTRYEVDPATGEFALAAELLPPV